MHIKAEKMGNLYSLGNYISFCMCVSLLFYYFPEWVYLMKSISLVFLHCPLLAHWDFIQRLKSFCGKKKKTLNAPGLCFYFIIVVQSFSRVHLFVTPWTAASQASLSFTNSRKLAQTHVHWVGDAIQPSRPLLSPSPPAFNLFQHQNIFQWVGSSHQVAKVLELQLQHQSFHWIIQDWFSLGLTGLIFLQPKGLSRLLAVQESKELSRVRLQHHSSKASILCCPAFFMVQFSYPYMTTGKIIALTIWTFFCQSNVSAF